MGRDPTPPLQGLQGAGAPRGMQGGERQTNENNGLIRKMASMSAKAQTLRHNITATMMFKAKSLFIDNFSLLGK